MDESIGNDRISHLLTGADLLPSAVVYGEYEFQQLFQEFGKLVPS